MKRQLDDYFEKFYNKEAKRFLLAANNYAKAKEIAAWKEQVVEKWDSIEIVSCEKTEELVKGSIESGKEYTITYVIDEKGLNDAIGLELVTTYTSADGKQHVYSVEPFEVVKKEGNLPQEFRLASSSGLLLCALVRVIRFCLIHYYINKKESVLCSALSFFMPFIWFIKWLQTSMLIHRKC